MSDDDVQGGTGIDADKMPCEPCTDINPTGWPGIKPPDTAPGSGDESVDEDMTDVEANNSVSDEHPGPR